MIKPENQTFYSIDWQGQAFDVPSVHVSKLADVLKITERSDVLVSSTPLNQWKMELDDSPIFRYLFRNLKPFRHLEFGTWKGEGTLYCLEESPATVWTINLPFGENNDQGGPAYSNYPEELPELHSWASKIGLPEQFSYRTDSIGFIGRRYLEESLGCRVCQIYTDSKSWDTSNYPEEFFDTVLVDGGHAEDIVINDTQKAFPLLKKGGVIMWHDFCPPVWKEFGATQGVMNGILKQWDFLTRNTEKLFWVDPSWILLGVKK